MEARAAAICVCNARMPSPDTKLLTSEAVPKRRDAISAPDCDGPVAPVDPVDPVDPVGPVAPVTPIAPCTGTGNLGSFCTFLFRKIGSVPLEALSQTV